MQNYAFLGFSKLETTFLHEREGLIAGDVYESRISGFKHLLNDTTQEKIFRDSWPIIKGMGFVPGFVKLVDRIMAESHQHEATDT